MTEEELRAWIATPIELEPEAQASFDSAFADATGDHGFRILCWDPAWEDQDLVIY